MQRMCAAMKLFLEALYLNYVIFYLFYGLVYFKWGLPAKSTHSRITCYFILAKAKSMIQWISFAYAIVTSTELLIEASSFSIIWFSLLLFNLWFSDFVTVFLLYAIIFESGIACYNVSVWVNNWPKNNDNETLLYYIFISHMVLTFNNLQYGW